MVEGGVLRIALAGCLTGCLLVGCGAAQGPADPTTSVGCSSARAMARDAWATVEEEAQVAAEPAEDAPDSLVGQALDRLVAHRASLRARPREVSGDEALALSGGLMDAFDEVFNGAFSGAFNGASSELDDALRNQADDAAEALLTDRSVQGSVRATDGAIRVAERVLAAAEPDRYRARTLRANATVLERRARAAAEGYDRAIRVGDQRADRAEAAPLPETASSLLETRARAIEVSREARSSCRIHRTLAVPR